MQDDKEDWAIQSQEMSRVFENALFVVAACSSPDTSTPFLGPHAPSDRLDSATFSLSSPSGDINHIRARDTTHIYFPELTGPLETRGWTWQERELSNRIINFLSLEVLWTCKETTYYEHGIVKDEDQSPWSTDITPTNAGDQDFSSDSWLRCIWDYSSRNLTYATDRLPAISGMAARFHAIRQCDYYAGFWYDNLPICLGWIVDSRTCAPNRIPLALENSVPSWSWASVSGTATWAHRFHAFPRGDFAEKYRVRVEPNIEVIEINCKPATQNKSGEVSAGGFLKLRGKAVDAYMECDGLGRGFVRRHGFAPQLVQPDCLLTSDSDEKIDGPIKGGLVALSTLRRARQAESKQDPSIRTKGSVVCVLLYSTFDDGNSEKHKRSAFVLVLGKAGRDSAMYERIAAGTGRHGPIYAGRQDWDEWKGWGGSRRVDLLGEMVF